MPPVIFQTPRLLARQLEPDDLPALVAVYGDADAMRWVADGEPLDAAECARWLDVTAANYLLRGYGMAALVEKSTGSVIGFCGLVHPDGQPEAEIKYALKRSYWGQGLATEAARAMLAYGAAAHGLQHIIATIAPENMASHRVLEKAGMTAMALRNNDDGSVTLLFGWQAPTGEPPGP